MYRLVELDPADMRLKYGVVGMTNVEPYLVTKVSNTEYYPKKG